jgi:hypothetical protein
MGHLPFRLDWKRWRISSDILHDPAKARIGVKRSRIAALLLVVSIETNAAQAPTP